MRPDEVASLARPVSFTLDGERFVVARPTMGRALEAVSEPYGVVPGLLDADDRELLLDALWDDEDDLDGATLDRVGKVVESSLYGCPWYVGRRLLVTAAAGWLELDGWATSRGVDLLALPVHRGCALVFAWLVRGADEKERAKLDRELYAMPAGVTADDAATMPGWSDDELGAGFLAAMQGG